MTPARSSIFKHLDYPTILLYLLLVVAGWVTIYAASYDIQSADLLDLTGRTGSQLVWMGITLVAIVLIMVTDDLFLKRLSPLLYLVLILVLVATLILAPNIKGSHSWLVLTDSIRIQPAEFAKVSTAMALAYWCSRYEFSIHNRKDLFIALGIFLLPMGIIIFQNETGSAIVFLVFFLVLYREGLTGSILSYGVFLAALFIVSIRYADTHWGATDAGELLVFLLVYLCSVIVTEVYTSFPRSRAIAAGILLGCMSVCGVLSIFYPVDFSIGAMIALGLYLVYLLVLFLMHSLRRGLLILLFALSSVALHKGVDYFFENVMQPHQQTRILVTLGLKDDPQGDGYNVNQSMIAIGSGGLTGKGFLNGTQTKLKFVPEQDTDFIFCTVGEEYGFLGASLVLVLYLVFMTRLVFLAERQTDPYIRIYGYSVASIFFFHLTINVGMVIGITPVIGIPLPFFSYGGSSFLSFSILLFIFLRLDSARLQE